MAELPSVSGKEAVRALARLGFTPVRQRGGHVLLTRQLPDGEVACVVPRQGELAIGTLRGVLRQAGITLEQFVEKVAG